MLGSSFEAELAERFSLPLVRYVYPVVDEVCLTRQTLLGAEGTAYLVQQIVNAVQTGGIPSGDTRLGGAIQIHGARKFAGDDSSRGCVEMLSQDMEIAYNCMELGDKVIILP